MFNFILCDNPTKEQLDFASWWFEEPFEIKPESTTLEDLLVEIKAFESKGQARKAGFFGKPPFGFTKMGPRKHPIWVGVFK